jgi:uncharacterized damage-inducible protein DinB
MRDMLLARWSEIGDKIVTLAEEFPEDRYETAPAAGTRSFGDQLRHVAFWNQYVHSTIGGEDADGQANELPRARYPTKDAIVGVLRRSFDDVKGAVARANGSLGDSHVDTLVAFIEHNGEHYGQLAVYYRLNGMVPPASR